MTKADLRKLVIEGVQACLTEGMLDNMMKGAKPVQLPPHLHEKLLGMGNVLAGGYQDQVSDDIKIVAAIMYYSSGNKETNIFDTVTSFHQKGIKENTMKRSELKGLIKEVVRQCVKEAGPQYKVRDGRSYIEQPGKVNRARDIQDTPEVNEIAPPGGEPEMTGEEQPYEEGDEIRLIKAVGKAIVKLLQMHKGMEEPEAEEPEEDGEEESDAPPFPPKKEKKPVADKAEGELDEGGPQYKVRDGRSYIEKTGQVNRAREIQSDPKVNESNHKVQHRSYKTINDVPQNPENLRDPEVPQA